MQLYLGGVEQCFDMVFCLSHSFVFTEILKISKKFEDSASLTACCKGDFTTQAMHKFILCI